MASATENPHRLDLQSIIEAGSAATGLSDMGEPDIVPGLQVLIDSYINDAHLHAQGVENQRQALIGLVANRLRIADALKRNPEIREQQIRGPIIITGLARSGTTKLQRMMASDPQLRWLPLWRLLHPMPLGPIPPGAEDPRIALTEQVSAAMREHFPDFYAGHPMNATEPDEEVIMADLALRSSYNSHALRIPAFDTWMKQQDHGVWYRFLHTMLQIFQWQGVAGKIWLLKAPSHLAYLQPLFAVFPQATIVHCHRDPVATTASMAKLVYAARRMSSDFDDHDELGRFIVGWWSWKMQRYMQQRPLLETQHRFVDVAYREITGNTTAAIERIYEAAGIELSAGARRAMLDWEVANPPGKHGKHSYSLEDFGVHAAQTRAAFADYLARFGDLV